MPKSDPFIGAVKETGDRGIPALVQYGNTYSVLSIDTAGSLLACITSVSTVLVVSSIANISTLATVTSIHTLATVTSMYVLAMVTSIDTLATVSSMYSLANVGTINAISTVAQVNTVNTLLTLAVVNTLSQFVHSVKTVSSTYAAAAESEVVAAVAGKLIKVFALSLIASDTATNRADFKNDTAGTIVWSVPIGAVYGANIAVSLPSYLFASATVNKPITLTLTAAKAVYYSISYTDTDVA